MKYEVSSDGQNGKIKSFTDLEAWQEAHKLAIKTYKVTHKFPSSERYGLTSQMLRASLSITSNISEGFSRSTAADKANFYSIALGSTTELQNQYLLSRDVQLIDQETFQAAAQLSVVVHKLISSLIKAVNNGKGVRKKPA
jgi:four helix bundle protein